MRIGINCGHTISGAGSGAVGMINESEHTRLVGHALMNMFRNAGTEVVDCTIDKADTTNEYLSSVVALANRQELDWFISIHFNASKTHKGNGVEVYTYKGRQYEDALEVCGNIANMGFINRGVKAGTGLYVIGKTKAKAMLIEICFCDNEFDAGLYLAWGEQKMAQAIFDALKTHIIDEKAPDDKVAIMGKSVATKEQLDAYLLAHNPQAGNYLSLTDIFLEEGEKEGVRGDIAFCQSCKETGFFKFGGDVKAEQHNYAGLGATGGVPGLSFPDARTGIRVQIQHLKAYASMEALNQECVDPRFKYVQRGCAKYVEWLGMQENPQGKGWATDEEYGIKILAHLTELLEHPKKESIEKEEIHELSGTIKIIYRGKDGVNYRSVPDYRTAAAGAAMYGEVFTVIGEIGDFYKLKSGWYITKRTDLVKFTKKNE